MCSVHTVCTLFSGDNASLCVLGAYILSLSYIHMSLTRIMTGDLQNARVSFEKAWLIFTRQLGATDPKTVAARRGMLVLYVMCLCVKLVWSFFVRELIWYASR